MKFLSVMAMSVLAVSLSAETIKYDLKQEFAKNRQVTFNGDIMTFKGAGSLVFKPIKLDPTAKYTLTVTLRKDGKEKAFAYHCGFYCFDKTGRMITCDNISSSKQSFTSLVKDVKVGDKTVTVKDGSKWKKSGFVAFNAKQDYSDLPNRTTVGNITKVEKQGDAWVITLDKPVKKAYAAGTNVRNHFPGGYVYSTAGGKLTDDWKTVSGTISGVNPPETGGYFKKFWTTTVTIRPMILLNWNWGDRTGSTQIKDVTLTITK